MTLPPVRSVDREPIVYNDNEQTRVQTCDDDTWHEPFPGETSIANTLGNQNAQLLSERPINEKRNVQLTTFWSKWRKKQVDVLVWCWITNIYKGIYGDNHAHGIRKHFGKGLVTGRQDSRHTVFLVVCTANATSCYRHIC